MLQTYMGMGNSLRHSLATEYSELETLRNTDSAVRAWVDEVLATEFARAKELIRQNEAFVERIADELETNARVTDVQVAAMRTSAVASGRVEHEVARR